MVLLKMCDKINIYFKYSGIQHWKRSKNSFNLITTITKQLNIWYISTAYVNKIYPKLLIFILNSSSKGSKI